MQILNKDQMMQKVRRMTYEILERHFETGELYFLGVNNSGYALAKLIIAELNKTGAKLSTHLNRIRVNAADPVKEIVTLEGIQPSDLEEQTIILVDDVANTGRTLFYAFQPLMDILPKRLEVAVMVDRKHKLFPVHVDYVGLSLATTLMENINVHITDPGNMYTSLA